jgi:hypothetical protein
MIKQDVLLEAKQVNVINMVLEFQQQKKFDPGLIDEVMQEVMCSSVC